MSFLGGVYFDDRLQLNSYSINLQLLTLHNSSSVINVAMDRIKAFVLSELNNVVFFSEACSDQAELFHDLGTNICILPVEPLDQVIGMMLYCKLNAITEDKLTITSLDISSSLSDEIWFTHNEDESIGPFEHDGWWHQKNFQKHTLNNTVLDNVVKVESTSWHEYGLAWPEENKNSSNTVVFAKFSKNEN
jgi:hypothetical protein